jgi:serine/threonine protein kinase
MNRPLYSRVIVQPGIGSRRSVDCKTGIGADWTAAGFGIGAFGGRRRISASLAEQKEPVKRKVAVKLIKPGMDSRSVLARFEAERQALALMDHPNIAKVFDGGMTVEGRPFFVMEFVKGIPLTEYCDQARLSLKERLQLFTPVCQAVQHAHQKGIESPML